MGRHGWAAASAGFVIVAGLGACSSGNGTASPSDGGGASDATGLDTSTAESGGPTGSDAGQDGAGSSHDGSDGGSAPTVVATFGSVPASLAIAGTTLYVTLAESQSPGNDGAVVAVPKASSNATLDGGSIPTLASGLHQPRAIAVNGATVFWADSQKTGSGLPNVMAVPAAGGAATESLVNVSTNVRLVIANSVLYTLAHNTVAISAYALTGGVAGSEQVVYPGNPPNGVGAIDSDGTSVFFLTNGATNLDLYRVPSTGGTGAPADLAMNATSGSFAFDYLVDDAAAIYWSDAGSGGVYSLAKAGGTPKLLATFQSGSAPVQLALDGDNIYALDSTALSRLPKAGGTPVILASVPGGGSNVYLASLSNAVALVVDDTYVYWLYAGHGQILRVAK